MMTFRRLAAQPPTLPTRTTWYLTDLAEARGKHELFARQSPQKLKVLREHALIESAISLNRIEGVEVDKSRGHAHFRQTFIARPGRARSSRLPGDSHHSHNRQRQQRRG